LLCQRVRQGDIPGSAIPDILHHNLLGLLTMAQLLGRC